MLGVITACERRGYQVGEGENGGLKPTLRPTWRIITMPYESWVLFGRLKGLFLGGRFN
jgi:hypothetical protein